MDRLKSTNKISVGTNTNKGIIDKIYDYKNLSINGTLYNVEKHKIFIK